MDENQRDVLTKSMIAVFGGEHALLIADALPLLEWMELNGGETLIRAEDVADKVLDTPA